MALYVPRYPNRCPKCGAGPYQPCRTAKTNRITDTHQARIAAAYSGGAA